MSREKLVTFSKDRVLQILKEKGKKQLDLANDIGISKDYLNKCINREKISGTLLIKASECLGVSVGFLDGSLTDEMIETKKNSLERIGLPLEDYTYITSYSFYRSDEAQKRIKQILLDLFILCGFSENDYTTAKELYKYEDLDKRYYHVDTDKELPLYSYEDQLSLRLFETIYDFLFREIGYRMPECLLYSAEVVRDNPPDNTFDNTSDKSWQTMTKQKPLKTMNFQRL